MKESKDQQPSTAVVGELQLKIKPERRAARIANTKIAESTKILASNKIIATSSLPPPPKPRAKSKQGPKTSAKTSKPLSKAAVKAAIASAKSNLIIQHNDLITKTVMVKKTAPTSILSPTARLLTVPAAKALASGKIASSLQGKQLTLLTKPLLKPGIGGLSGKVPLLVFNQASGQVQSYIPLTHGSLPPNTVISIAAPKRPASLTQQKLVSVTPKSSSKSTSTSTPVSKTSPTVSKANSTVSKANSTVSKASLTVSKANSTVSKSSSSVSKSIKSITGLIMECEDDELSAVQRIACKKAESEYVELLRKLTKWKKDPEVQVVTIGADDPIPPLPVAPDVIEASKLPLNEDHTESMEVSSAGDTKSSELISKISDIQSGSTNSDEKCVISVKAAAGDKIHTDTFVDVN
ncbi:hypothetical protein CHUAL_010694 [Chamberlinius hualienensis]